jgi:hypothetical protein
LIKSSSVYKLFSYLHPLWAVQFHSKKAFACLNMYWWEILQVLLINSSKLSLNSIIFSLNYVITLNFPPPFLKNNIDQRICLTFFNRKPICSNNLRPFLLFYFEKTDNVTKHLKFPFIINRKSLLMFLLQTYI